MIEEQGRATRWPDGFFTVADGTRLHYVEAGEGAPVILIHGARGSAIGNWFSNGIAPKLAETNHVYALDMRGHGLSGGERHGHLHMAADVIAFMDQKGIAKAHFAGYSMGGGVMLQILAKAPDRFLTACFQGSGVSETAEWRDRVPPDVEGRDPDEERANANVRARREAKGEEVGNNRLSARGSPRPSPQERPRPSRISPAASRRSFWASTWKAIDFPVMAINGPNTTARTPGPTSWRASSATSTNLVLPGKGHLKPHR